MSDAAQLVLDVIRGTPRAVVRLLMPGDVLPDGLDLGFDHLGSLDRDWVWIAERGGKIEGVLAASPCHGTAIIWRLFLVEGSPFSTLAKLLRGFLKDMRLRGIAGYITLVDETVPAQVKLKAIVERANRNTKSFSNFTLVASPLPEREW